MWEVVAYYVGYFGGVFGGEDHAGVAHVADACYCTVEFLFCECGG